MSSFNEAGVEPDIQISQPKFLTNFEADSLNPFCNGDDEDETPIFNKRRMPLRIPESYSDHSIMHLTVSKNWLVCILQAPATALTTLLRFFLPRALPPGEIDLDKYLADFKITKLFLDPTGFHTLMPLVPKSPGLSADFLYIHGNGPKVRRIEKFKDDEITAVAFNHYFGTESSTGPILLGTSRGLIYETELALEAEKPLYKKQVYDLGLGRSKYPITGMEVIRIANSNKYSVVATTPDCIYTFQETLKPDEKSLQAIFAPYVNGTQVHNAEKLTNELNYSTLRFYAPPNEMKCPKSWAVLHGSGVRVGEVSTNSSDEAILLGDDIIKLNAEQQKDFSYDERQQLMPRTFVLTQFHLLLLYADHIKGICMLNDEVVLDDYYHERVGKLLNIVRDYFTGSVYIYTNKTLFNYKITDEDRNVWRIYLNKGLYDIAEMHAAENPEHLNIVLTKKADVAFENKDYVSAANIYADTQMAFEEICLKFVELDDQRPIITYVKKRLQKLNDNPKQIMALVVWLVDLYLTQINLPGRAPEERAQWQSEYDEFMRDERVAKSARENRAVIQKLIADHADTVNLTKFAIANEDYGEVIKQHVGAERYREALLTLAKQKDTELFYKYCPILVSFMPQETVEVLISQGRKLDIVQLVPTLIATETPKHTEQIIKYLEFAVYNLGETAQSIHNYLLRLYAEHKPKKVITYLETEGHDTSLIHYDINYALSVCLQFDVKEACVFLHCLLRMWTAAVELALTFDVKLAKETASKPDDEEVRRKLWVRIAREDIQGTNDVKKALDLLKECDILRIEDLLPFFSDFEKIDDFKEPICNALKEYIQKINELQHDMDECTKQADQVRTDLQNVRERCVRIESYENCMVCESYLLVKPFFVFACGHKFHSDCLEKQVVPLLSSDRSRQLTMTKQQLESLLTQSIAMADHSQEYHRKREKLKKEIEEILASDCLYCGLMIETIDQPFVEDWDQVNVDWE